MIFKRGFLAVALALSFVHSTNAVAAPSCAAIFSSDSKIASLIPGPLRENPKAIIFSAPSGAGKSTLMKLLTTEYSNSFEFSVSTTTRAPRGTEKNGVDYNFTTVEDFETRIVRGEFIEYAKVHGNYYGTSRADIDRVLNSGKSIILDIDVQGADVVRKALEGKTLSIFIRPPNLQVLEQRLRGRGTDSEETIQKRMKNAINELSQESKYDTTVINDDLPTAFRDLKNYLISVKP